MKIDYYLLKDFMSCIALIISSEAKVITHSKLKSERLEITSSSHELDMPLEILVQPS